MRQLLLVCLLTIAGTAACKPNQGAEKKAEDKSAESAAKEEGAAKGEGEKGKEGEEAKTVCDSYADALCDKVGEKGPDCQAVRTVSKLLPDDLCKAGMEEKAMAATLAKVELARKDCTDLATKLCTDLGDETESCKMVREQTPNFPPQRCTTMMERYDEVLADLKKREEANKPLDEEKQATISKDALATFGPTDSKVTIVEFSDFQCPFCSRAADAVTEIKKKYGDKVHFVFRQFPLSFHKDAHLAAQAALAAGEQGKFWEYHDKLFENQRALSREDLEKYAKELKLDLAKFKKALDKGEYKDEVDADLKLGETVAVSGTPTMFLNGKRISNPTDTAAVSKAIDEALKAN